MYVHPGTEQQRRAGHSSSRNYGSGLKGNYLKMFYKKTASLLKIWPDELPVAEQWKGTCGC